LTQSEIERLVTEDLAAQINVTADQIQVSEVAARTWPDQQLGCGPPRSIFEPQPTPGYLIILTKADQTFRYHTDQQGRFVRCEDPGKLIDPIVRP
jgi:hypothetical protein